MRTTQARSHPAPLRSAPGHAANAGHDAANKMIRQTALAHGAEVIDINALIAPAGTLRPEMTYDGLHFTPRACAAWVSAIESRLATPVPASGS